MKSQSRNSIAVIARSLTVSTAVCLALASACAPALAQTPQQDSAAIMGQVTGADVSVATPSQPPSPAGASPIAFAAGSTIVVHSGQARVDFTGGGELDVCGPAKFTVLASGEALTIALNFGRIRAKLDPSRPLTIYTPLITATPLAVMSQPRDVTLGLEPNTGAMCVLAAHGALQVQQQLSGEALIVPEPTEVSLTSTPLAATPAAAGSCRCDLDESSARAASPERVLAEKTIPVGVATGSPANPPVMPQSSAPATPVTQPASTDAPKKIDQPDTHLVPQLPAPKPREPVPPPTLPPANGPITKIVAPPLLYESKPLPAPMGTISVATVLLAKAVVVEPEWIFHGVVAEPAKASGKTSQVGAKQASDRKKKGFRAWLHRFLFGTPTKST